MLNSLAKILYNVHYWIHFTSKYRNCLNIKTQFFSGLLLLFINIFFCFQETYNSWINYFYILILGIGDLIQLGIIYLEMQLYIRRNTHTLYTKIFFHADRVIIRKQELSLNNLYNVKKKGIFFRFSLRFGVVKVLYWDLFVVKTGSICLKKVFMQIICFLWISG